MWLPLRGQGDVLGEVTGLAEAADEVQGVTLRWSLDTQPPSGCSSAVCDTISRKVSGQDSALPVAAEALEDDQADQHHR